MSAKAVVACFLIQEGASLHVRNILGQTPLESCTDPVLATVLSDFAEKNAGLVCSRKMYSINDKNKNIELMTVVLMYRIFLSISCTWL